MGDRFEDAWFALAFVSLDFVIERANSAMGDVLGREPAALVGSRLDDLWPDGQIQREREVAAALRAGESPVFEYERTLTMTDGSTWTGLLLLSLVRDDDGTPARYYLRLKGAGDERGRPARIEALEGDFPLSVEQMGIGIALIGLDSRPLLVNRALCDITGRSREELLAIDLLSFTHPDDRDEDIALGTKAWTGEIDGWTIEKRIFRGDGSLVWVRQEISVVRDGAGDLLHFVGQVIDIDDRKRAERQLADSQAGYRELFETVPVGLLEIDTEGRVLASNPAASEIAGRVIEVGSNLADFVHPHDLGPVGRDARPKLQTGQNFRVEFRVVQPSGAIRWVRNDIHPKRRLDGGFVSFSGSWIDVTELHEAEEELKRQARQDPLTSLANRTLLQEHCDELLARRRPPTITVLFVDLDGFKGVNDRFGHTVGDAVLQTLADRIRSGLRAEDFVARIGGDEFVVVCTDVGDEVAAEIARRVIDAVREPVSIHDAAALARVGASIGVAHRCGDETISQTIRRADGAVYDAKRAGGATFVIASDA